MSHTITVYSKPECVQCDWTYKLLDKADKSYDSFDVTADESAMQAVKDLGYLAAPVVVVKDGAGAVTEHWSGFQPPMINKYI